MKNHIAMFRHLRHVTQTELAVIVGVSKNAISDYECGNYLPALDVAFRLAAFFNVPLSALFYFDE